MSFSQQTADSLEFDLKSKLPGLQLDVEKENFLFITGIFDEWTRPEQSTVNTNLDVHCINCHNKIRSYTFYWRNLDVQYVLIKDVLVIISALCRIIQETICIPCYYAYRILPDFDITIAIWQKYMNNTEFCTNNINNKEVQKNIKEYIKNANR